MELLVRLAVAIVPVVLFLLALVYLDSFKLVRLRWILATIGAGALAAGVCYAVSVSLIAGFGLEPRTYSRFDAPIIEETAKALILIQLIRRHRVGFLVDAAIHGFSVGTGFAVVENLYYLQALPGAHMGVWVLRGFGTALMHGGATAVFGIVTKALTERERSHPALNFLPGLATAGLIHAVFNQFYLSPVLSTLWVLVVLPPLVFLVFDRSERSLREWLCLGFDADAEMLELIDSGEFSESRTGVYLNSLKERFRGEVVADLLCYLKIHLELSLRGKGVLMMRERGFHVEIDPETRARFSELVFLEHSIGRTGKLAVAPFMRMSHRDLWQLYMLGK